GRPSHEGRPAQRPGAAGRTPRRTPRPADAVPSPLLDRYRAPGRETAGRRCEGMGTGGTRVEGSERDEDARVRLPQLRLDELLEELQARIDAARGTRDRVRSLLEAVLSVGRELELEQVLHSIVEAAA